MLVRLKMDSGAEVECLLVLTGQDAQQDPVRSTPPAEHPDELMITAQMFSNCQFRQMLTEVKTTHAVLPSLHSGLFRSSENTARGWKLCDSDLKDTHAKILFISNCSPTLWR